jgi:hypothetical protein
MEVISVAQQVITKYTDDLDGSEASGTIEFSLDAREYEIDLSDQNAARLRDVLAPFVAAAQRVGGGRGRQGSPSPKPRSASGRSREGMAEMRRWLRENGYKVSDRGRIPRGFVQAYDTKTPASAEGNDQPTSDNSPSGHAPVFRSA